MVKAKKQENKLVILVDNGLIKPKWLLRWSSSIIIRNGQKK